MRHWRRWNGRSPTPEVAEAVYAWAVTVIDPRGDRPAGQLVDLTPVAPPGTDQQVGHRRFAAPGPRRLAWPKDRSGLPHRHARIPYELVHRRHLPAAAPAPPPPT